MSAQGFVLQLGRALHELGSASYRVEDAMDACCRRFGLRGSFFATPTAIFAAISNGETKPETVLLRVRPGENDLGKLTALYEVRDRVMQGRIDATQGLRELAVIVDGPPTHGWAMRVPAWALGSAAAAVFLGGGASESAVAAGTGLLVALFGWLSHRSRRITRAFEAFACALAAFLVQGIAHLVPLDRGTTVVASIVPLLPGLMFTTALSELAIQHLASGSARLMGSLMVMLTMAVGLGLGGRAGVAVFGDTNDHLSATLPAAAAMTLSVLASSLAFAVLLRARWTQVVWVLLASAASFGGAALGILWFAGDGVHAGTGRELSAFVGALVAALAGNLYSRFLRRPAAVVRTPGLLLLVPGSLGLRGLSTALQGGFQDGSEFAFRMVLVGGSIVAGLLVAGVVLPPPLDVEPDSGG